MNPDNPVKWDGWRLPCIPENDNGVPPGCGDSRCPLSQENVWLNNSCTKFYIGKDLFLICKRNFKY